MYKPFVVLIALLLAAGPATATDRSDVLAVIHQWALAFNKGDLKAMEATCGDQISIIDDFPPYAWQGAGACSKWSSDFLDFVKAQEITVPSVEVGKAWHIDVTGDLAYYVAPATFSFQQKGSPVEEKGIFTVVLQKRDAIWRMTGWAWGDR